MDVPPGLLSEGPRRRLPVLRILVVLLLLAAGAMAFLAMRNLRDLERERDRLRAQLDGQRLSVFPTQSGPAKEGRPEEREALVLRIRELEERVRALESSQPATHPRHDASRAEVYENIERGQKAFRKRDYPEAETCFLRAALVDPNSPEPYGWLVLAAFVRGEFRTAWRDLLKAFQLDPNFLKNSRNPDKFFVSREEYLKFLSELETHVRDRRTDEGELLLAYFHYHEKGANYSQMLVSEILGPNPEHADAAAFQRQLDSAGQ